MAGIWLRSVHPSTGRFKPFVSGSAGDAASRCRPREASVHFVYFVPNRAKRSNCRSPARGRAHCRRDRNNLVWRAGAFIQHHMPDVPHCRTGCSRKDECSVSTDYCHLALGLERITTPAGWMWQAPSTSDCRRANWRSVVRPRSTARLTPRRNGVADESASHTLRCRGPSDR